MSLFIISYILLFLAAFFNACMDCFENTPNFNESIFKNLDKKFWCKDVSWQYAKKLGGYKFDAWHMCKSSMIICIDGAISLQLPSHQWLHFICLGVLWNLVFVAWYHKIFKVK